MIIRDKNEPGYWLWKGLPIGKIGLLKLKWKQNGALTLIYMFACIRSYGKSRVIATFSPIIRILS